jgi:hypothetical protein
MYCGTALAEGIQGKTDDAEEFNIEDRIPCQDGTCTGIIIDGKCTECGKSQEEALSGGSE